VAGVFAAARALGLDASAVNAMSDAELEARLHAKASCLLVAGCSARARSARGWIDGPKHH
jgi:hypothetical protein